MELKVWVEGIQRIVCGVTETTTTCQDVVFALAHAIGKVGRFTLIERWRNNERLLAPNENPLKVNDFCHVLYCVLGIKCQKEKKTFAINVYLIFGIDFFLLVHLKFHRY